MAKKTKKTVKRTITLGNVKRPEDTEETTEQLQARLANTPASAVMPVPQTQVQLKREHIRVAEQVFQWRVRGRNLIPSETHIIELATAIKRGDVMPPITVFPVGRDYYVMDGHHRLAAHDMLGKKTVAAKVFTETLREAEREALRANNKNKLPMTKSDRTSAAWRLVRQEDPADSIKTMSYWRK